MMKTRPLKPKAPIQKNKVIAYRLLTRDSVEEKIRVLQHQKNQLVSNVLGDEGFASSLDLNDLQFILAHGGDDTEEDEQLNMQVKL